MSPDFDFDLLNELIDNAPVAGFGPQVNFGKCTILVEVSAYDAATNKFKTRTYQNGEVVDKSKGEKIQITFKLDVGELNPALTREWKRRVDIKHSNKTNSNPDKWVLTDFDETVAPSLVAVIGKDWIKKLYKGMYVEIEDAE